VVKGLTTCSVYLPDIAICSVEHHIALTRLSIWLAARTVTGRV